MSSPYQNQPPNDTLTPAQKLGFYRQLCNIRQFDQITLSYYKDGQIGGFLPLCVGQEAVAVGTIPLLGENDHLVTSYRHTHHSLTSGISMNECMAELFGKTSGCSKGKGGALSYFSPENNHWGSYPITGTQAPIATGIAFALKYRNLEGCCVCFLGDGEVASGAFHEALNLAALHELPVLFIIENNGFAFSQTNRQSTAFKNSIAEKAESYGIGWDKFDDRDLYEIRTKTQTALTKVKTDSLPMILEIETFRFYGFSIADAGFWEYSPQEIVADRRENHDPLKLWAAQLIEENLATKDQLKLYPRDARNEAKAAANFAKEGSFPTIEKSMQDIYSESTATGRHFFN